MAAAKEAKQRLEWEQRERERIAAELRANATEAQPSKVSPDKRGKGETGRRGQRRGDPRRGGAGREEGEDGDHRQKRKGKPVLGQEERRLIDSIRRIDIAAIRCVLRTGSGRRLSTCQWVPPAVLAAKQPAATPQQA